MTLPVIDHDLLQQIPKLFRVASSVLIQRNIRLCSAII